MATSPTTLDLLHRFFRHEEEDSIYKCVWNVAAGALEKRLRLYRIYYKSDEYSVDKELTVDVKYPDALKEVFMLIAELQELPLDPYFRHACLDLIIEDPWLSVYLPVYKNPPIAL
jgi:hypothetical protein